MFTCKKCLVEFEEEGKFRGHRMRCKVVPSQPEVKRELPEVKEEVKEEPKEVKKEDEYFYDRWHDLPPPVIDWLKINFGGWLNHFEVGKTEYRKDFGGYGIYVKVPKEYSTEWKTEIREKYDNIRRKPATDKLGNPLRFEFVTKDVRYVSLQLEMPRVLNMLGRIKEHIIRNAHSKGIRLPSIGDVINSTKSLEDYKKSLYN